MPKIVADSYRKALADRLAVVVPHPDGNYVSSSLAIKEVVAILRECSAGPVEQGWVAVKAELPTEHQEVLLEHIIDDHEHVIDIAALDAKGEWYFPWIGRLAKEQCAPVWPLRWMHLPSLDATQHQGEKHG